MEIKNKGFFKFPFFVCLFSGGWLEFRGVDQDISTLLEITVHVFMSRVSLKVSARRYSSQEPDILKEPLYSMLIHCRRLKRLENRSLAAVYKMWQLRYYSYLSCT